MHTAMNRYQQLGTFIVRLLAGLSFLSGLIGLTSLPFYAIFSKGFSEHLARSGWSCAFYLLLGVVLYFLSRFIGKILGKGLD